MLLSPLMFQKFAEKLILGFLGFFYRLILGFLFLLSGNTAHGSPLQGCQKSAKRTCAPFWLHVLCPDCPTSVRQA